MVTPKGGSSRLKAEGVSEILSCDLRSLKLGKIVGLVLLNDNELGAALLASLEDLRKVLSASAEGTECKAVVLTGGLDLVAVCVDKRVCRIQPR